MTKAVATAWRIPVMCLTAARRIDLDVLLDRVEGARRDQFKLGRMPGSGETLPSTSLAACGDGRAPVCIEALRELEYCRR